MTTDVKQTAADAVLDIPGKFLPAVRHAALGEMKGEGEGLAGEAERALGEVQKSEFFARYESTRDQARDVDLIVSDICGAARFIGASIGPWVQILEGNTRITGDADNLIYVLDHFARHTIPAALRASGGPLEGGGQTNLLRENIEALEWAGEEMARLRVLSEERIAARDRKAVA